MTQAYADIRALHSAYQSATGFDIALDFQRESQWYEAWKRGIRAQDITALIGLMRWKAKHDQPVRSLKFRTFVGNADYLEEDVQEMRARKRVVLPNAAKATVLQATGRPVAPEPPKAKSVADLLSLSDDFDALKRMIAQA